MPRRLPLLAACLAAACLFDGAARAQQKDERHRSPRATVRTLFTVITVSHANPWMIEEAASCLDLSELPADQRSKGSLLATQLEAVLRARDVDTDFLPEDLKGDVYLLSDAPGQRIALKRQPDGRWLFDAATVTQIPRLYTEALKRLFKP